VLVMMDVNVQLPASLTTIDDPRLDRTAENVELAPRGSLGLEWELAPSKWLRAGLSINRSASERPQSPADVAREDYIGGSLGFAWQKGRTQTALGAFYLHGLIDTFVQGVDPPRRADASARLFGGLFTVSYRL
jgi:hypothetical protein